MKLYHKNLAIWIFLIFPSESGEFEIFTKFRRKKRNTGNSYINPTAPQSVPMKNGWIDG